MQQVKSYNCFLTENGDVVLAIPFVDQDVPKNAEVLYAGGEHALFCKTPEKVIILDYLNEAVRPQIKKADRILLFEINSETQEIVNDYFVPVKHIKKLPSFTLQLEAM